MQRSINANQFYFNNREPHYGDRASRATLSDRQGRAGGVREKKKDLLEKVLNNQAKLMEINKDLISGQNNLIKQQENICSQHNLIINMILERDRRTLPTEIQTIEEGSLPLEKKTPMRLVSALPLKEKNTVIFYPKQKYNVTIDNIPIQYLANTFQYRLTRNSQILGRNTLYEILKEEGIMWEDTCEIDREFIERGYFVWQRVKMPSGILRNIQFCTPSGWQWLNDRFNTDWSKYVY